MFVERLTSDRWTGNRDQPTTVENPSWPAIEQRIQSLNGTEYTMVTLSGEGDAHLSIGGGNGRYVVYATSDNLSFHNLVDPVGGQSSVSVVAGGQAGDYPARQVVSLDKALDAARQYAETGTLSKTVHWEEG